MLQFAIFAVTFVVALIVAVIYLYPSSKKTTTIPGLEPTSEEDGNLPDIKKAGSLHEFLLDLHKQVGPIASFWMGRQFVVSVASPELFKEQLHFFDRPPFLFKLFEPLIGAKSIQFANKGEGRMRRKLYDGVFRARAVASYYACIQKVANDLVAKWETMLNAEHIPLSQYVIALAIKAIAVVAFGETTLDDKTILEFHRSYDTVWTEMELSLWEGLPEPDTDRDKRLQKGLAEFYAILRKIIGNRTEQIGAGDTEERFVDVLINSGFDEETIANDACAYMVGGFHTSGNLMIWAFYFLASHPEVQERAAAEVKEQLGGEDVDHENCESLVYLRQVLDETLRCAVIAPYAARFQDTDSTLGGHHIPKDTPVIHALGVMLQDAKYWPHPNKFDPDRFDPANTATRPSLAFEPFGFAGKRKCPGYLLSYAEVTVVVATVLRKFRISLVDGQFVTPVFGLVCHPAEEIWITLEERETNQ